MIFLRIFLCVVACFRCLLQRPREVGKAVSFAGGTPGLTAPWFGYAGGNFSTTRTMEVMSRDNSSIDGVDGAPGLTASWFGCVLEATSVRLEPWRLCPGITSASTERQPHQSWSEGGRSGTASALCMYVHDLRSAGSIQAMSIRETINEDLSR